MLREGLEFFKPLLLSGKRKIFKNFRRIISMKKLVYLIVVLLTLGLIVAGCIPVVPTSEQDEIKVQPTATTKVKLESHIFIDRFQVSGDRGPAFSDDFSVYKLFRGGVKWSVIPVEYYVNLTDAPEGAFDAITKSAETWDNSTVIELFKDEVDFTTTTFEEPGDLEEFYGENTISWASFEDLGLPEDAVAVNVVWFWVMDSPGGATGRVLDLAEFHIINNSDLVWAVNAPDIGSNQFDVQNVDTHEFGHSLFLDDLYMSPASELTMLGYTTIEETKKQDLGLGDILGLQALYGE